MAFLNNILEIRSDAFKMTVHTRRPLPSRTDTIGPWLDALTFLTWLGALTNSALVYLFSPQILTDGMTAGIPKGATDPSSPPPAFAATGQLLMKAVLVSLIASHGFLIVRSIIRHLIEKIFYKGSAEVEVREREEREVKEKFLAGTTVDLGSSNIFVKEDGEKEEEDDAMGFWEHDEGIEEIQRLSKEA